MYLTGVVEIEGPPKKPQGFTSCEGDFLWWGMGEGWSKKKYLLSRRYNWKCFQKNIASYQGGKLSFTLPAFSKLLFTIFLQWKISGLFDSCQVFFLGTGVL